MIWEELCGLELIRFLRFSTSEAGVHCPPPVCFSPRRPHTGCLATGLNVCALVGWTGIPVSFDLILPWGLSPAAWWPQTSITTACSTLRRPIPLLKRDDSAWSKPRDFLSSALLRRPAMNPAVLSPNSGGEHLPPGKPCTLAVHCQPPEKGTPSAVLVFIDNGLRGTPAIPMAGAGPSSAPCITAP
jgi:hypothetical protein